MASQMAFFLAIISALSYSWNSCPTMWLMRCRCVIGGIPWSHVYAGLYLVQGLGSLVQAGERLGCSLFFCYGPSFPELGFLLDLGRRQSLLVCAHSPRWRCVNQRPIPNGILAFGLISL